MTTANPPHPHTDTRLHGLIESGFVQCLQRDMGARDMLRHEGIAILSSVGRGRVSSDPTVAGH